MKKYNGNPLSVAADGVEIRDTRDKGRGLFATKKFSEKDVIMINPTIQLGRSDADIIGLTKLKHYVFEGERYGESLLVLGPISMANHASSRSKSLNAQVMATNNGAVMFALKDIQPGQEILIDYGWDPRKDT